MKKVVISGGSGLIGGNLTKLLVKSGYEVVILTRNPSKFHSSNGISYSKLDLSSVSATSSILDGAYSVINLAGSGVADKKWTLAYKEEIHNSRINITSHLVQAINSLENKPNSFISASAIGIYGDRGDESLNEKSHLSTSFLSKVCMDWEQEADDCSNDVRVVKTRLGIVLAKDGGALSKMIMPFRFFIGGPLGSGKQWMSWIHIDDVCNLYLWCIENNEVSGVINFTSPNPVTMNYFAYQLGKSLNRPSFLKVPEFALKLILGESSDVILASQRVYPTAAEHLAYKFIFEDLNSAFEQILD